MYNQFCENAFLDNVGLQSDLYDKMMNVAIEFEESGFIIGLKTAMEILDNLVFLEAGRWQYGRHKLLMGKSIFCQIGTCCVRQ